MFLKYLLSILFWFFFFTAKNKNNKDFSLIIFIPVTDCTCKTISKFSIFYYHVSQIKTTHSIVTRLILIPAQMHS